MLLDDKQQIDSKYKVNRITVDVGEKPDRGIARMKGCDQSGVNPNCYKVYRIRTAVNDTKEKACWNGPKIEFCAN